MIRSFISILLFTLFWLPMLTQADVAGKIVLVKGQAHATDLEGNVRTLKRRSEVLEGDILKTDINSQIQIRFNDNAVLALRPESELAIREYHVANSNNPNEKVFMELLAGGFRTITGSIGKSDTDAYQVKTPEASIGIRGTNYELVNLGGKTLAGVWNGGISLKNDRGSINLGLGSGFNFAAVTPNSAPQGLLEPPSELKQTVISKDDGESEKESKSDSEEGTESQENEESKESEDSNDADQDAEGKGDSDAESKQDAEQSENTNEGSKEESAKNGDEANKNNNESTAQAKDSSATNSSADRESSDKKPAEQSDKGPLPLAQSSSGSNTDNSENSGLKPNSPSGNSETPDTGFSDSSISKLETTSSGQPDSPLALIEPKPEPSIEELAVDEPSEVIESAVEELVEDIIADNSDTDTSTKTDITTDTGTGTDVGIDDPIDPRITNAMVEALVTNPNPGFVVLTGQEENYEASKVAIASGLNAIAAGLQTFRNNDQAQAILTSSSGTIHFPVAEVLEINVDGATYMTSVSIPAGTYGIAELAYMIQAELSDTDKDFVDVIYEPTINPNEIIVHSISEGSVANIQLHTPGASGGLWELMGNQQYLDSYGQTGFNNNVKLEISYTTYDMDGNPNTTFYSMLLDKNVDTNVNPFELVDMMNDDLFDQQAPIIAVLGPNNEIQFISLKIEDGAVIDIIGLTDPTGKFDPNASIALGFDNFGDEDFMFGHAIESHGDAIHWGYLVKDENGVPHFINYENERIDVIDGNFIAPDVVFRGSLETWQNHQTLNNDTSSFDGSSTVVIENVAGLPITWGYWFNDATNPANVASLDPDPMDTPEFPRAFFFVDAEPALPHQMTGTANFNRVDAQMGLGHDGVVNSFYGSITIDFSTGQITDGYLSIGTEGGSYFDAHDMKGMVDGPQAHIDHMQGNVFDMDTNSNYVISGDVQGLITNNGDSFAGGYHLEATEKAGIYVDGVFVLTEDISP